MYTTILVSLLLILLWSGPAGAQVASWQMTGVPHITVTAELARQVQEVRISPGRALMLVFDTPVRRDGWRMDERERFQEISLSTNGRLLSLLPLDALPVGMRLGLTVDFADDAVPMSLNFTLVVSSQSQAQLNVYRQPRPASSDQREAEETQTRLSQCRTALREERALRERPPGLLGLLVLNQLGEEGVRGKDITADLNFRPGEPFAVRQAIGYHTTREGKSPVMRWAVDLQLMNNGATPWRPVHAQFVGSGGQWAAEVWTQEALAPGMYGRVLVEVEVPGSMTPGMYLLQLWDEEERQLATLSGVTFP